MAPCPVGEARITGSYGLPCRHIIHAVGPIYSNDAESAPLLASAYRSSLELADRYNLESIAFPSISTGIFGYPLDKAVIIALNTIKLYTRSRLKECYIYCFDDRTYDAFSDNVDKDIAFIKEGNRSKSIEDKLIAIKQAKAMTYQSDSCIFLLDYMGDSKHDYAKYFRTMNVDQELSCIRTADYDTLTALLTMMLREDHFDNGAFRERVKNGEVDAVLDQMIERLEMLNK